jgi:hypothetical protein
MDEATSKWMLLPDIVTDPTRYVPGVRNETVPPFLHSLKAV